MVMEDQCWASKQNSTFTYIILKFQGTMCPNSSSAEGFTPSMVLFSQENKFGSKNSGGKKFLVKQKFWSNLFVCLPLCLVHLYMGTIKVDAHTHRLTEQQFICIQIILYYIQKNFGGYKQVLASKTRLIQGQVHALDKFAFRFSTVTMFYVNLTNCTNLIVLILGF